MPKVRQICSLFVSHASIDLFAQSAKKLKPASSLIWQASSKFGDLKQ